MWLWDYFVYISLPYYQWKEVESEFMFEIPELILTVTKIKN